MFIASLLTNPDHPVLDRVTVESLRNAWGGGDARWLDPGVAAEFAVGAMPANRWEVWAGLQAIGVDLVVQPVAGRKKRVLLADMDSTMIRQECIDELADEAGVGVQVAGITARAMNGEIAFEGALQERVALLVGLPEHADAGWAGVGGDDEGERGLCRTGVGGVCRVYGAGGRGAGV
jgi:phosphoserine phosphatase